MPSEASSWRTLPSCFRGHSSFRGINDPEDTHPFEKFTASRTLLLPKKLPLQNQSFLFRVRRPQQLSSLISDYIHGARYAAISSHVSNVATTPASAQAVTWGSRNHSRNQGHNSGHWKNRNVQIIYYSLSQILIQFVDKFSLRSYPYNKKCVLIKLQVWYRSYKI